ncbi:hypothetical protein TWF569_004433 [Orbilia oligospora]|uniref:Uncharacterized protein n=1 Tax=Orbilia oligospora TaxID=2813651 RepID=A0A7C8N6F2_ORBOL|nr:hypothetical protein TWF706_009868 [Orbilia oligospora]KAF3095024.1 hypothetical protein TWF102_007422 [Orbilia oligospora]KAF3098046.1 hypothetical protein TWF103_009147 [Orbilia oligospora]KAF3139391.1 hypothetical protein TWF594_006682 [Orbilia oligospora]KAF3150895.1 hypothetical protein TWF569_004433 [Orbilia oligospora]
MYIFKAWWLLAYCSFFFPNVDFQTTKATVPAKVPSPAPPTAPLQSGSGPLPAAPSQAPATNPAAEKSSSWAWPVFLNSLQLRSFHSISALPHILPRVIAPPNPSDTRAPVEFDLSRITVRGCTAARRSMKVDASGMADEMKAPIGRTLCTTCVVRMKW